MNNEHKMSMKRYTAYVAIAAAAVLLIIHFDRAAAAFSALIKILSPLFIGMILAYILNLVMLRVEKLYFPRSEKKFINASRRPVCLVMSILLIFVVFGLVCLLIIPEISNLAVVLKATVPYYFDKFYAVLEEHKADIPMLEGYIQDFLNNPQIDWQNIISSVVSFASTGVGGFISSTVSVISTVFGGIVNFVIGIIFAVYILYNKEKLYLQCSRLMDSYLKERFGKRVRYFCATANKCFSSFIFGQCTEAVILGVLCALGMTILKLPYATTIGTLVGVTALIPIVGAYIGAVVGALMILVVDPIKAVWFLIFLVILQQVEGNVIYPKVVGSSIGLPGMWVLAAVTVGGGLGGIPGMLVGVPLTATVYQLVDKDVSKRLDGNDTAADMQTDIKEEKPIVTPPAPVVKAQGNKKSKRKRK